MGVKAGRAALCFTFEEVALAALWVRLWGRVSTEAVLGARRERVAAGTRVPVEKV